MDIIQLYSDYNIQYWTEGKNVAPGWVNIQCPFCGDDSNHLGFNTNKEYFNCWKCGSHPIVKTLAKIINLDEGEIRSILNQYGGRARVPSQDDKIVIGTKRFKYPSDTKRLSRKHKLYLENRGFDPERLEYEWDLLGTGPCSVLDKSSYKYRIIAPIYWDNRIVSFQSRDITNKQTQRYKVCPREREIIHHKHILYGKEKDWYDFGIVVEGITDVWRLGTVACATFGIEFNILQVKSISQHFERVVVLYDDEPQAIRKADLFVGELRAFGIHSTRFTIKGDPGGLKQSDADYLVKHLKKEVQSLSFFKRNKMKPIANVGKRLF